MMFQNSKNFIGDNTIEGLDELARETVSNDNEPQDDVGFLFKILNKFSFFFYSNLLDNIS